MTLPLDSAIATSSPHVVDARVYHDAGIFAEEQRRIFRGPVWSYVALEAELEGVGAFKSTYVGDTPVVVTRGTDNALYAWVNRCAHKGALVCRAPRGKVADGRFVCVYHQWAYDGQGNLRGVPFRRGLKGEGGMAKDFDMAQHSLQKLRVASLCGMVFLSFDEKTPPLEEFLGEAMCRYIRRVFNRPVRVLGYARQNMRGNWKLYSENSRDGYHGGLLHLFYPTFGIYRPSQESAGEVDEAGFHNAFTVSKPNQAGGYENYQREANREMSGASGGTEMLRDPSVLAFRPEFDDNIALLIQSLFPSVVLQQIQNTLATRQIVTRSVAETELVWTYFGYADDDDAMTRHRIRNINLVGPAGYISMEDGEAVELCQQGTAGADTWSSLIEMGGNEVVSKVAPIGLDENAVRGFWKGYFGLMRGAA
ncbi:MAG: aromatic ring-hydroxylating dioxygenase subunit alpha [Panacagrimonas sp.]